VLRQYSEEDARRVRLNFRLSASENRLLVGDLLGQPKGKLRHARLVTLATIGLLTESQATASETLPAPTVGDVMSPAPKNGGRLPDLSDELLYDVDEPERG
jgi:hypothetical protein